MEARALLRLLHLASPALPVGAFSYSQGLESAVEAGIVTDAATAERWITQVARFAVARCEGPALHALLDAWRTQDAARIVRLNDAFLATRETAELRAETIQMGYSLARLLNDLDGTPAFQRATLASMTDIAFPTAWAAAASELPPREALDTYLWAWAENQVMGAVKLVPLGQTDGQRILMRLIEALPAIADEALSRGEDDWENFTPHFAILCSQHETQYTRLFRS
ncbi:MAG: urease accessory UreF family protein [Moraxellaceae bacterium]|nr:urease accessory UreF family protein [Moraxellaceae bacterium]